MNKRLSQNEFKQIVKLIKNEKSLNQIAKKLNRSKTTIYYHFLKIKGRTIKHISSHTEDEELIGEFLGLFAGDGCMDKTSIYQYRTHLCFNINEKAFVKDLIKNVLFKLFRKRPMIFRQGNRLNLRYYSKYIHGLIDKYLVWNKNFRKTYSVQLKNQNQSNEFIAGFLRGCLDSDGYHSKEKIQFATVSQELMKNITNFLVKLKITHSVRLYKDKRGNRKDIYFVYILKCDHNKFLELIKPRNIKD